MSGFRFVIRKAKNGEHYWVAKDGNNRIVATGETHPRDEDALRAVRNVVSSIRETDPIEIEEEEDVATEA